MVMISAASTSGSGPERMARYLTRQQPKMQIVAIDRGSDLMSTGIPCMVVAFLSCHSGVPVLEIIFALGARRTRQRRSGRRW